MTFHRAEKQRFTKFSVFNKKSIVPVDITMPPKITCLSLLQGVQCCCPTKKPIIVKNSPTKLNESPCQHKSHKSNRSPSKIFQKALKKKRITTESKQKDHKRFGIYVSPECGDKFVPAKFELSKNRQRVCIDTNENPYLPTPKDLPGTINKFPTSELKLLKFKINYYWKSLSKSHYMTIPYGITFKSFLRYCQQEIEFMIPNDCIALAHTENFQDDDKNFVLTEKEFNNNYLKKALELMNLFEKNALKVVDCEDIWKIIMENWNHQDNFIEVTLFSAKML
ncbi:6549_t:CDS:2 [Gigaspora rosea]|nr:6549_t:CDS:2 [Gigaspora rosea]